LQASFCGSVTTIVTTEPPVSRLPRQIVLALRKSLAQIDLDPGQLQR